MPRRRRLRRRTLALVAAAPLVGLPVLLFAVLGDEPKAIRPVRYSAWVVPRVGPVEVAAGRVPVSPNAAAGAAAPIGGELLVVEVKDVEGGPIPGARVMAGGQPVGETDERGTLRVVTGTAAVPGAGKLVVRARGYGTHEERYTAPGTLAVKLVIGSVLRGRVLRQGTDLGVPGLVVTAGEARAISDDAGAFTVSELPAQLVRLEARGPGWYGVLPHPVALGQGRVVDGLRLPVSRAYAVRGRVLREGRPAGAGLEVSAGGARAVTDGDGRYVLEGLTPGAYALVVTPRAPGEHSFPFKRGAGIKVVDHDVVADVELGVRARFVVETVDGAGRPIPRVQVLAQIGRATDTHYSACETGADGRCVYAEIPPGPVRVTLDPLKHQERELTVPVPHDAPVRFVLAARGRIAGRLLAQGGRPRRPRFLRLRASGDEPAAGTGLEGGWIPSALDGSFRFEQLEAGRYTLEIADATMEDSELSREITLSADQVLEDLVIVLPGERVRLTGRVLDPMGASAPDVLVSYRRQDPNGLPGGGLERGEDVTTTDAAGFFHFDQVIRGPRYTVSAYRANGDKGQVDEVLPGDAPVLLQLSPRASLRVLARGQEGVGRWTLVTVFDGKRTLGFSLEPEVGRPVHIDNLPAGTWTVHVQRGIGSRFAPVVFTAGQLTELAVDFAASGPAAPPPLLERAPGPPLLNP